MEARWAKKVFCTILCAIPAAGALEAGVPAAAAPATAIASAEPLRLAAADADGPLVIKWLPCTVADHAGFFSLSVSPGGEVVFTGGPQTRESGEHQTDRTPFTARRILTLADSLRRYPESTFSPPKDPKRHSPLCIELTERKSAGVRTYRVESASRMATTFTKELLRLVPLVNWVCPERAQAEEPYLASADFCGKYHREK